MCIYYCYKRWKLFPFKKVFFFFFNLKFSYFLFTPPKFMVESRMTVNHHCHGVFNNNTNTIIDVDYRFMLKHSLLNCTKWTHLLFKYEWYSFCFIVVISVNMSSIKVSVWWKLLKFLNILWIINKYKYCINYLCLELMNNVVNFKIKPRKHQPLVWNMLFGVFYVVMVVQSKACIYYYYDQWWLVSFRNIYFLISNLYIPRPPKFTIESEVTGWW